MKLWKIKIICLFFGTKKPSLSLLVRQPKFFELIIKGVAMRDLLEKALNKGLTVSFTSENGFDVIRISSGNDVVASCSLGTTSFRASVEESLQALLLDLERKGF